MYSREKVELFLLATEDGMRPTAAAEFAGVTVSAAKKWATGHFPRSYTGRGCRIGAKKTHRMPDHAPFFEKIATRLPAVLFFAFSAWSAIANSSQ